MTLGLIFSGVVVMSGCSTISKGVDSVGQGVVALGEGFEKIATDVQVEALSDQKFALSQIFQEPVSTLDSWAMRIESKALCPDGYIYENRNARKVGGFEWSHAECAAGSDCRYQLEWRIQCQDVPEEPFSLFGKT